MLRATLAILVLCSDPCPAIRVPVAWHSGSDVQHEPQESLQKTVSEKQPIPDEYFLYTAKKPQFAVDIATFHGVQSPKEYYKSYPIKPYTGKEKPELGKHKLLNENIEIFNPYQDFTQKTQALKSYAPASVDYEIFHPYKAEEPALQQIYKDPVLEKIRNDIRNSQYRLQKYEKEAGKPDINKEEYLETPEETDRKKLPHRNVPARFEIHRPQRRPVYYKPVPLHNHRDHILNQKFKHPWNQHNAMIRPLHYRPLKNHLQKLRQHHALKYDDERNEYPQLPPVLNYAEPVDGYDIYERGKAKYVQLRNNVDESINKAVKENRPTVYQKLELQNNGDRTEMQISDDDDDEFVPIKNYAQVRKTETTMHLPKKAAFEDADNFDELKNAPRLREAVKSTKAQTVYTEEGYEDAAYDHAGEQKHASENEGHAGYLKEKELSEGKYKIPSVSARYDDGSGSAYRDQTLHGEKWKNNDKQTDEETHEEDYSEDEQDKSIEADIYQDVTGERNKRENNLDNHTVDENAKFNISKVEHEVNKRETKFKVPEIDFKSTFLTEDEISRISKLRVEPAQDNIKEKYPYYFRNLKNVHKHSPLRYAENLKLIPKKSKGGTEFYDSRTKFECPEVDEKVDAIPDKLKREGHPDSDKNTNIEGNQKSTKTDKADFDNLKEQPRLKGLGDKIDCFKAKYFGENPLDSPFFKEDIISNPEPVTLPNLATLTFKEPLTEESKINNISNLTEELRGQTQSNGFSLLEKLINGQKGLQDSLVKTNDNLRLSLKHPQNLSIIDHSHLSQQSNVYTDILQYIRKNLPNSVRDGNNFRGYSYLSYPKVNVTGQDNIIYNFFQNKEDITQSPQVIRKKRATPFVYEPYKIIRDGQTPEVKKSTITSNTSPLIKQLQSSRIVDRVAKTNQDKEQPIKRNVVSRTYKDIGKKDREKSGTANESKDLSEVSFIDVNVDQRRGEPRYELRPANHKPQYTPVEAKKSMTVEDYETHTNQTENKSNDDTSEKNESNINSHAFSRRVHTPKRATARPYFDISQFLPKSDDIQKPSASNTIRKIVKNTTDVSELETKKPTSHVTSQETKDTSHGEDDYEEYEDEEESSSTTTTTTPKPYFRQRKARLTTSSTTIKPQEEESEPELPKLRLITRFNNVPLNKKIENKEVQTENVPTKNYDEDRDIVAPKYSEKKKKSSESTLVTDSKSYGDGDDDLRKEEVDALIGIQHDMDEYTPNYEKKAVQKNEDKERESSNSSEEDDEFEDDDEFDDEDDDDYDDDNDEEIDEESEVEPEVTTPEPTKRTLIGTTEAPSSTTEARSAKLEIKPVVLKKKIEIHKELPINKSSPHVTQFKQDIKEVEIIKEVPTKVTRRKPQKNVEVFDLYKDENLAKDINKLGGVEVFKQNLDLVTGPKHGGNYRSAKIVELREEDSKNQQLHGGNLKILNEDAETSQSENKKQVELSDTLPARRMHGGNLKSLREIQNSRSRNARLELGNRNKQITARRMHGGNLKAIQNKTKNRESNINAKLIEFEDGSDEQEETTGMHGGNFKPYGTRNDGRSMHGGNYRNAKIVQVEPNKKDETPIKQNNDKFKSETINARKKAAVLLNSFAQAVPILTTTPVYILDPSKRMYYYVDA